AGATFEAGSVVEVEGFNGAILVVGKCIRRRTVPAAFDAVALPTFQPLKQGLTSLDSIRGDFWLSWNLNRRSRLFGLPLGRKVLDVGNQIRALHFGKGIPLRHIGIVEAAGDGVVEIFVSGQSPGRRGTTLELGYGEVSRFGIKPLSVFALSIAQVAVAPRTIPAIVFLGIDRVAGHIADMTFHPQPLVFHVRRV